MSGTIVEDAPWSMGLASQIELAARTGLLFHSLIGRTDVNATEPSEAMIAIAASG
jgi:hypothetical protein